MPSVMKTFCDNGVNSNLESNVSYQRHVDRRTTPKEGNRLFSAVLGSSPLWLAVLFFVYGPNNGTDLPSPYVSVRHHSRNPRDMADFKDAAFWNKADMTKLSIPPEVKEKAKSVTVKESKIKVQDSSVFYREAVGDGNHKVEILLLHGMRFSSKTWLDLGTIHLLAAMGYRVVAVDLPGYAETPAADVKDKGEFLHQLIQGLKLKHPVISSPSMSGTFALPYLLSHWKEMGGYVPVAPVGWEVLEKYKQCNSENPKSFQNVPEPLKQFLKPPIPDVDCIQVPTLVVYGENDRSRSSALLCLLPFSQAAEIPKGAHPAYLTDPDLWHKLLFNFLGYVESYANQKSN